MGAIEKRIKIAVEDYMPHEKYIEIESNGKEIRISRRIYEEWIKGCGFLDAVSYSGTADERKIKLTIEEYWQRYSPAHIKADLEMFLNFKIREVEMLFPNGSYAVIQQIVTEVI